MRIGWFGPRVGRYETQNTVYHVIAGKHEVIALRLGLERSASGAAGDEELVPRGTGLRKLEWPAQVKGGRHRGSCMCFSCD